MQSLTDISEKTGLTVEELKRYFSNFTGLEIDDAINSATVIVDTLPMPGVNGVTEESILENKIYILRGAVDSEYSRLYHYDKTLKRWKGLGASEEIVTKGSTVRVHTQKDVDATSNQDAKVIEVDGQSFNCVNVSIEEKKLNEKKTTYCLIIE